MGFKRDLAKDGMVHGQSYSNYQDRKVRHGRKPNQAKIDICLNCTKEKCTGTKACFKKMRAKENNAECNS